MRDSSCLPDEYADIYTVSEITAAIRQNLESEFPRVSVIGEIANFKAHTSGHLYFSLRDEQNLIRVVIFRRYVGNLSFGPENGMLVISSGQISHYGGSGQTQLLASNVVPAGRGMMELEFRRLLQKLMDEGLTAPERKRRIPPYPQRIVVITSPTGAVIRDILDAFRRRWPVAEVIHICADVQGPGAVRSIPKAFRSANGMRGVDVIILARGGGSIEELWTFNLEEVARAVAGSTHPVITGIGHEIDTTVVDYVSDVRAATPTAAAEIATPLIDDVTNHVDEHMGRLESLYRASSGERLHLLEYLLRSNAFPALIHRLDRAELKLDDRIGWLKGWWEANRSEIANTGEVYSFQIERSLDRLIRRSESRLAKNIERVSSKNPEQFISSSRESLKRLSRLLRVHITNSLDLRTREVTGKLRALMGLYPLNVLERGYTYCTTPDGRKVIERSREIARGDKMAVHFYDGGALCSVERKRKGRPWQKR